MSEEQDEVKPDNPNSGNMRKWLGVLVSVSKVFSFGLIIALLLFYIWQSNRKSDELTKTVNQLNGQVAGLQNIINPPPPNLEPRLVSMDNDAVLGNSNAPLTIIEFADYECPYCKQSFEELLPELKKNYIDTGTVKLVYRDLPLSFHENAQKEAEAAECAKDQGGNNMYFKYHDQIYAKTTSNGTGLALTELSKIAKALNLDVPRFQACLDSNQFKEEVERDAKDAESAGADSTPSWFIGKSTSDGVIKGKTISGALSFEEFKVIIEEQIK